MQNTSATMEDNFKIFDIKNEDKLIEPITLEQSKSVNRCVVQDGHIKQKDISHRNVTEDVSFKKENKPDYVLSKESLDFKTSKPLDNILEIRPDFQTKSINSTTAFVTHYSGGMQEVPLDSKTCAIPEGPEANNLVSNSGEGFTVFKTCAIPGGSDLVSYSHKGLTVFKKEPSESAGTTELSGNQVGQESFSSVFHSVGPQHNV